MDITCPRCRASEPATSAPCTHCGAGPRASHATPPEAERTAFLAAGDAGRAPERRGQSRPIAGGRRQRWFRRKRVLVPVVMVVILLIMIAAGAWYIKTRFDALNELSTPPAEISGSRLGGEEGVTIDTGPAQEAVRAAEAREQTANTDGNAPVATATNEGATNEAAMSADATATGTSDGAVGAVTGSDSSTGGEQTGGVGQGVADASNNADLSMVATQVTGNGDPAATGDAQDDATATSATSADATQVTGNGNAEAAADAPDATSTGTVEAPTTTAASTESGSNESVAILMMGVDARPGEAIDVGVRPDSLAVAFLDGTDGSCRMLSIPRDTRVELPGYGQSKINHALAVGGIPYQMLVVEGLTGIELDHYGLVDFDGVQGLVDAVGGVTVINDEAFSIDGHDFAVGNLELNGEEALAFSRYRYGSDGDFGRQERQQQVVRALLTQGADLDIARSVPRLLGAVEGHIRTDFSPGDMIDVAQDFRSTCTAETLETGRVEGGVATLQDDLMQMPLSFVVVQETEVRQKIDWLQGEGQVASAGG